MVDMRTTYMGLSLKNPIVASASPLWREVASVKRVERAGAAAVVLPSLFEEQVAVQEKQLSAFLLQGTEHYAEALTYLPDIGTYHFTPELYVEHIARLKEHVSIPVIGSLNGMSTGGWTRYAIEMQRAGADALELNLYFLAADPAVDGAAVEQQCAEVVSHVKSQVHIPVAVKLSPFFSSIPAMAHKLRHAGADALVLFNRFYQPDIDPARLTVRSDLKLSTSDELLLRLRWIGLVYGRVEVGMALTGGVHTAVDMVKSLMAGADVAMMTSALLANGIDHVTTVLEGLKTWLQRNGYDSVGAVRGVVSRRAVAEPAAYERANYIEVLGSFQHWTDDKLSAKSHR